MRSDHAFLPCSRRCPVCSGFADLESSYGDVVSSSLSREEAHSSYVDLSHFLVRIEAGEVCVDGSCVAVYFCVPLVRCFFGYPGMRPGLCFDYFLDGCCFIKAAVVDVNAADVLFALCKIPVAVYVC